MDPMEQAEEERRRKELFEWRDMEAAVSISVDKFLEGRDFSNLGKDVHPSGLQTKKAEKVAASLRVPTSQSSSRKKSNGDGDADGEVSDSVRDFDLMSQPRILANNGSVNKKDPEGILRRLSKRYLYLFSDVLLVTIEREKDTYDLHQVIWIRDLRLKVFDGDGEEDRRAFELIVSKPRNRGALMSIIIVCDTEQSRRSWVNEIENALFAYHRDTPKLGWFHDLLVGTFHSAAHIGDVNLLRKHLRAIEMRGLGEVDAPDNAGMTALHYAALAGHEICVRLLLDNGADVDAVQDGGNTPLLLAAARGHDAVMRLLIDRGADIRVRNRRDKDAVFMAVVYGHAAKGLPWVLQILNDRGLDLNVLDSSGATPLHVCAERNLARPVRMLVDAGADVNVKHGRTLLTPLLMASSSAHPDVETIRSFLDKGAFPNWRDVQGRSAFDLIISNQRQPSLQYMEYGDTQGGDDAASEAGKTASTDPSSSSVVSMDERTGFGPPGGVKVGGGKAGGDRWRPMDSTLEQVGDWAVKALPALLELSKKGGRFNVRDLETLRPSFKSAVLEARECWEKKNFVEFVLAREQAGEEMRRQKEEWAKDKTSVACMLCTDIFGLRLRRHHCRCCGALVCDSCSTKRMLLTAIEGGSAGGESSEKARRRLSTTERDTNERVCDGCFNRMCHEAQQPSPDHFRVKHLKQCAITLMESLSDLVDALDDPEGDPHSFQASLRETMALTRGLDSLSVATPSQSRKSLRESMRFGRSPSVSLSPEAPTRTPTGQGMVDALKLRETKLSNSEDLVTKFLEAADGYHRVAKKLIEQKIAKNRLWGSTE